MKNGLKIATPNMLNQIGFFGFTDMSAKVTRPLCETVKQAIIRIYRMIKVVISQGLRSQGFSGGEA